MSRFTDDSHARCWVKAGLTGNVLASFNITSVTDTGTGVIDITIATDFASADWACVSQIENIDASIDAEPRAQLRTERIKAEAQRRIIQLTGAPNLAQSLIKQVNRPDEFAPGIAAIRKASDALEQTLPEDYTDDRHWP